MINGVSSPEIQKDLEKLFSSILMEQQKINAIKPADPSKENVISDLLKEYETLRGRGFFHHHVSSGRGHGPFAELIDGSVKYDLINAIGVNLLGHSHPIYIKSHLEAATSDAIMCGNLLTYQEPYELTKVLVDAVKSTSRLRHFWFTVSGSCANDTALKIVWQKKAPKYKLLALDKAFAGRTVATQDITYNASYREGMPQKIDVERIPNYDYKDPSNALQKTLSALDKAWEKDPESYCAIMLELVQGEGGFIFGTADYYKGIFEWAKKKNIYIWIDEVQTFGRTHQLFAFQTFGLEQYVDIVTVGKALQACGVFYTEELNPKAGLIAGTFNGCLSGLKAGAKTIKYLLNGNFYGPSGRIVELEQKFITGIQTLADTTCKNKITYVGGLGTMIAFEVGDSGKAITEKFIKTLFTNGIVVFSAGNNPMRVRLLLPLCLTDEHIAEILQIIEKTVLEVVTT